MTNVTGMFDNLTKLGNFLPESNDESYTRPKPLNQSGPKKKKKVGGSSYVKFSC